MFVFQLFFVLCFVLVCAVSSWKIEEGIPTIVKKKGYITEFIKVQDLDDLTYEAVLMYPNTDDYKDEDMIVYIPEGRTVKEVSVDAVYHQMKQTTDEPPKMIPSLRGAAAATTAAEIEAKAKAEAEANETFETE
jgi:DNA-binding transcriptional regulator of glucitol operon